MSFTRFFENSFTGAQRKKLTVEEVQFYSTSNTAVADFITPTVATFSNKLILTPPPGQILDEDSFKVYVNGITITPQKVLIEQNGPDITATFDVQAIGYSMETTDTIILIGKFI